MSRSSPTPSRPAQTVTVSGGTLFISSASGGTPVSFTNGTLEVTALNAGSANLTATHGQPRRRGQSHPAGQHPADSQLHEQSAPLHLPHHQIHHVERQLCHHGLSLPSAYGGYASNDPASSTIYLVLTNGPITPFLTWVGASGGALNSTWDFIASDWTNTVKHDAESYVDGALVTFDDTGRTNVVNLTGPFLPLGVTINNSVQNYTFAGVGAINGTQRGDQAGHRPVDLGQFGRRQLQRRSDHRRGRDRCRWATTIPTAAWAPVRLPSTGR